MSAEQNKSIVYRWVEEAWNQGNFSSARTLYPADYQLHDDTLPAPVIGPDGICEFVRGFRTGAPDIRLSIEQVVAEGNFVAWSFRVKATQTGMLLGIPPTNRQISITGMVLSRFENGKWVEDHANWDVFTMLRQLGVIPQPAA